MAVKGISGNEVEGQNAAAPGPSVVLFSTHMGVSRQQRKEVIQCLIVIPYGPRLP